MTRVWSWDRAQCPVIAVASDDLIDDARCSRPAFTEGRMPSVLREMFNHSLHMKKLDGIGSVDELTPPCRSGLNGDGRILKHREPYLAHRTKDTDLVDILGCAEIPDSRSRRSIRVHRPIGAMKVGNSTPNHGRRNPSPTTGDGTKGAELRHSSAIYFLVLRMLGLCGGAVGLALTCLPCPSRFRPKSGVKRVRAAIVSRGWPFLLIWHWRCTTDARHSKSLAHSLLRWLYHLPFSMRKHPVANPRACGEATQWA